jgi:two-component system, OmpR family, alkaline phosphatase synthesis response regulator PhoP
MSNELLLIVDDEHNIVELIELYARQNGFRTVHANDGVTALDLVQQQDPALIVLDLMLPRLDGWEVCRRVRSTSDVPIIMLTARDDDIDKIIGLEIGADDYVTKPFNPRELMARIKAVLRRKITYGDSLTDHKTPIRLANLTVDRARHEVMVSDQPVKFRAKEFDLLVTLLENKGIVFTREKLLELVWGFDFAGETRTVDVHVAQLRKHISGSGVEIETVFGVGYKLI